MKWQCAGDEIELPRSSVIIDTNVLFAFFFPDDAKHEDARVFIEEYGVVVLIPIAVLVETWGLLVGREKRRDLGQALLEWISNPGTVIVLGDESHEMHICRTTVEKYQVDIVDALIICLAHRMTAALGLNPPISVVSFDTRDLVKLRRAGYGFVLWDLHADEKY